MKPTQGKPYILEYYYEARGETSTHFARSLNRDTLTLILFSDIF
ncbi:MAG: hypothetical protein WAO19_14385 [Candidatus Kryptoniota bacterium]